MYKTAIVLSIDNRPKGDGEVQKNHDRVIRRPCSETKDKRIIFVGVLDFDVDLTPKEETEQLLQSVVALDDPYAPFHTCLGNYKT